MAKIDLTEYRVEAEERECNAGALRAVPVEPEVIFALIEAVEASREVESDRTLWEQGFGPRLMRLHAALAPFTEDNE